MSSDFERKIEQNLQSIQTRKKFQKNMTKPALNKIKKQWQRARTKIFQVRAFDDCQTKSNENLPRQQTKELNHIIDVTMVFLQNIIDLGERINSDTRVQLFFIFFQAALCIIFNSYNMVVCVLQYLISTKPLKLGLTLSLVFYSYHVFTPTLDVLITIVAFTKLYSSIAETARVVNQLNLYVRDEGLRLRLSQFAFHINSNLRQYTVCGLYTLDGTFLARITATTSTYIIILLQYGLETDLTMAMDNESNKTATATQAPTNSSETI